MLRGFDEDVILRGCVLKQEDKTFILDTMMASLRHYRERLHKINYDGIKADQDPKILFDTIKRFIVGDLTNEFKDFSPGHFPTWAIYVSRVVYLKRRLGELGAPINDEAAVALVMEGVNHNHANLYGRLTRGMGRCDSKWSKLVEDLERVAAKYGGTAPLMCQDLRGLPSITAGFGPPAAVDGPPDLEILEVRQL